MDHSLAESLASTWKNGWEQQSEKGKDEWGTRGRKALQAKPARALVSERRETKAGDLAGAVSTAGAEAGPTLVTASRCGKGTASH